MQKMRMTHPFMGLLFAQCKKFRAKCELPVKRKSSKYLKLLEKLVNRECLYFIE